MTNPQMPYDIIFSLYFEYQAVFTTVFLNSTKYLLESDGKHSINFAIDSIAIFAIECRIMLNSKYQTDKHASSYIQSYQARILTRIYLSQNISWFFTTI